jgi:threonine dehydratase
MDSASDLPELPTFADVRAAAARIAGRVLRTPVLSNEDFDADVGARVFFKCENLQTGGAFKLRGASNAVLSLSDKQARHGVVTHSSGNHGAALARAARLRGIACHVVVPQGVNPAKLRNMQAQGAQLHVCAPTMAARDELTARLLEQTGAESVPPFDDARVIAGQGTAALELVEDFPDLNVLVTPAGGGGLLSGTALVGRAQTPPMRVFGAEPANADDAAQSMAAGHRVTDVVPDTLADGLRATIGVRNFAIMRRDVEAIWTVSEDAIVDAMRLAWERLKLVIEPASAVAIAAILDRRELLRGLKVGVVITGGNADLDALPWSVRAGKPV